MGYITNSVRTKCNEQKTRENLIEKQSEKNQPKYVTMELVDQGRRERGGGEGRGVPAPSLQPSPPLHHFLQEYLFFRCKTVKHKIFKCETLFIEQGISNKNEDSFF